MTKVTIETANLNQMRVQRDMADAYLLVKAKLRPAVEKGWDTARATHMVESLVNQMEAGYAALKDATTKADRELIALPVGQGAYVVALYGYFEQGKNGRALEIYQACRRAIGEDVPGEDPEVAEAYRKEESASS